MKIEEEEVVRRLGKRLTCRSCGRICNPDVDRLADPAACPSCGGELYQREDDKPETVRKRLTVYAASTAPLKEYYRAKGLLHDVDASGSIARVNEDILAILRHA